jgi:hypothetical protein
VTLNNQGLKKTSPFGCAINAFFDATNPYKKNDE